ncbi:hypothetical protein V6N13_100002 [Hibiscus sabdariffa]
MEGDMRGSKRHRHIAGPAKPSFCDIVMRSDDMVQAQHGADGISGCPMGADGMLGLLADGGGGLGPLGCAGHGPKGAVCDM